MVTFLSSKLFDRNLNEAISSAEINVTLNVTSVSTSKITSSRFPKKIFLTRLLTLMQLILHKYHDVRSLQNYTKAFQTSLRLSCKLCWKLVLPISLTLVVRKRKTLNWTEVEEFSIFSGYVLYCIYVIIYTVISANTRQNDWCHFLRLNYKREATY